MLFFLSILPYTLFYLTFLPCSLSYPFPMLSFLSISPCSLSSPFSHALFHLNALFYFTWPLSSYLLPILSFTSFSFTALFSSHALFPLHFPMLSFTSKLSLTSLDLFHPIFFPSSLSLQFLPMVTFLSVPAFLSPFTMLSFASLFPPLSHSPYHLPIFSFTLFSSYAFISIHASVPLTVYCPWPITFSIARFTLSSSYGLILSLFSLLLYLHSYADP
jgi:hypothetical protein